MHANELLQTIYYFYVSFTVFQKVSQNQNNCLHQSVELVEQSFRIQIISSTIPP